MEAAHNSHVTLFLPSHCNFKYIWHTNLKDRFYSVLFFHSHYARRQIRARVRRVCVCVCADKFTDKYGTRKA